MKKDSILKNKNLKKITTTVTVLIIALTIISSSSISIPVRIKSKTNNLNFLEVEEISNGPAPRNIEIPTLSDEKSIDNKQAQIGEDCPIMYGIKAYPNSEGIVYFDVCNCDVEVLCEWVGGFFSAGTYSCDGVWYGVEYGTGVLWGIDPYTCDMWSVGGGGTGLNGLAYDPVTNRMFGVCSNDNIWQVNPDTGEQTLIGSLGYSGGLMIGMAYDAEGQLYGWDLVSDKLWKVDPDEPSAEEVGSLGISINYAQDGDFHRESDQLYLTAYTSGGNLYKCDKETGACTLICNLEGGITASIFLNSCIPLDHDVSIKSINYPESGYAIQDIPMQVTVKNFGNNSETTDVQMQVIKYEPGPVIFEEDFSGTFPPEGWETDYWNISYSNESGGSSPETRVYNYDQYYQGDYYDNYITSAPIDCTGFEKVNLKFKWAADYKNPQYASVYVKFRRNSTSPWKDVTPWDNPVGSDQKAHLWEISCYSFNELFDDEFQIKWEYIGYYYYFNYLWLDDVEIVAYNRYEDYNETVEDLEIEKGEEVIVDFPTWIPPNWQDPNYENIWEEYRVKACTLLDDDKPNNDCKDKLIDLYYPWIHDIEIKSIDSPCEDGPGKTYPVQATIKNIGQNAECCIPIDIKIGESIILDSLLIEDAWNTVPPEGWQDEHKSIGSEYGWNKSYTAYCGGESPEIYLPYNYAKEDYVMYSYAINTTNYPMLRLQFKTYIDHYSGEGLYALEAGYSTDKEFWYSVWHEEPGGNQQYKINVPVEVRSETTYIGFWVKGNPYYFNNWYIDGVKLQSMGFVEEYSDFACQGPDLEPGEEVTFTFDDWTPAFLAEETTGTKDYIIEAKIELEGDKNPYNDIKNEIFTLEYWHDVGIDEITSPTGEGHPREGDEILWDNGVPDGRNGLPGSMYQGYSNIIIDDFLVKEDWTVQGGHINFVWNSGYTSNTETIRVYFFQDLGDCDPSLDEFATTEANTFTEIATGNYYFSRPEIIVDFLLDDEIKLTPGKWYVGIQPDGITENIAYLLTAKDKECMVMADLPYYGYPRWSSSQYLWGQAYDLAWQLDGTTGGPPAVKAWIQPGTQDIDTVVKNYGTFIKEDLTCYAEIWEYITDPENGTKVYTDEIDNIDLTIPLGGKQDIQFADFTFADEGRYGLFLEFPAVPDDEEKNNYVRWGIGVDDTRPYSWIEEIDPPEPDGQNGWYISPATITLKATDPWSNGVSSGVKEIRFTIDGGAEQVIPGNIGSIILTEDGKDILIEFWAVDWVGNVETPKNQFTFGGIDQTVPEISLSYEVTSGNPITGWILTFTATAIDATSGMDYVEFYFNDLLQEIIMGPGPTYEWVYTYYGGLTAIIKAIAYDKAGLFDSDEIKDPVSSSNSHTISSQKSVSRSYQQFINPLFRLINNR